MRNNNEYIMPKMDNDSYIGNYVLEEKKSKFYSFAYYIETENEAKDILKEIKQKYKDASHVVYAYRLINKAKYSDDKEPKNTAGKPIYDILEKKNIVNILIIVVRYFGGTLLGSGPLLRAYKNVSLKLIQNIELEEYMEYEIKNYTVDYNEEKELINALKLNKAKILKIKRDNKVHLKAKIKRR